MVIYFVGLLIIHHPPSLNCKLEDTNEVREFGLFDNSYLQLCLVYSRHSINVCAFTDTYFKARCVGIWMLSRSEGRYSASQDSCCDCLPELSLTDIKT